MVKAFLLTTALLLLCSCSFFEMVSKGEKVVQIGNAVLYKSDVEKVMPRGASALDSVSFAEQYVNSWILKQLMLNKAEEKLPKNDKDVTALLEEYRTQLLVFRYETKYVEERLDTLISETEKRAYYTEHQESFITKNGIIKGRFVKMHNSSPSLQIIKTLSAKSDAASIDKLEELAYNTAYKYDDYANKWVDMPIVARDMEVDISDLWRDISKKKIAEKRDSSYSNFLQVIEYVLPGEITPYEYNADRIDEIILSKRKQELISALHKDIFNDAINSNKINFIKNEDN